MEKREYIQLFCFILVIITAVPMFAQTGSSLFDKGLLKENAEGDLKTAITLYQKVVKDESTDRSIAQPKRSCGSASAMKKWVMRKPKRHIRLSSINIRVKQRK